MRVLHLITRANRGGALKALLQWISFLQEEGYALSMASGPEEMDPDLPGLLSAKGVPLLLIPHLAREISPLPDALAFLEIRRAIREARPDLLHTHTSKAGFLGRLAGKSLGVPVILHTPHGHIFERFFPSGASLQWLPRFFLLLERMASTWCHGILALSEKEKSDYVRLAVAPAGKIVVVPHGIRAEAAEHAPSERNLELPPAEPKPGFPVDDSATEGTAHPPPFVVVVLSRLVYEKGIDVFLKALPTLVREHPEILVVVAGEGPMKEELENLALSLKIQDHLRFLGYNHHPEELLAGSDLFVLPSRSEGFGFSLLEAMAAGKAVVSTRVGGVPELVLDGETGLLVPPEDPYALAEAVKALLANRKRREEFGRNGRKRVTALFSEEEAKKKLKWAYQHFSSRVQVGPG